MPLENLNREFEIRSRLIYALFRNKVLGYGDIQKVINDYQKNPLAVLKKYGLA